MHAVKFHIYVQTFIFVVSVWVICFVQGLLLKSQDRQVSMASSSDQEPQWSHLPPGAFYSFLQDQWSHLPPEQQLRTCVFIKNLCQHADKLDVGQMCCELVGDKDGHDQILLIY